MEGGGRQEMVDAAFVGKASEAFPSEVVSQLGYDHFLG
jgi:hypothetical protein